MYTIMYTRCTHRNAVTAAPSHSYRIRNTNRLRTGQGLGLSLLY